MDEDANGSTPPPIAVLWVFLCVTVGREGWQLLSALLCLGQPDYFITLPFVTMGDHRRDTCLK